MPKILSEEERQKSKEKRQEYLKKWREEHGMEYYTKNKEKIKKQQRDKREKEKGSLLNSHNRINIKDMTKEEKNTYYREKMRKCRARKKQSKEKQKEKFDLNKILDGEYYIVDCEEFVYFARKVRLIGFGCLGYKCETEYISDIEERYSPGNYRHFYLSDLTQYKTFKEAQKAAKKLNKMPENKKRLKTWISSNFSQEMMEFKYRRDY